MSVYLIFSHPAGQKGHTGQDLCWGQGHRAGRPGHRALLTKPGWTQVHSGSHVTLCGRCCASTGSQPTMATLLCVYLKSGI